MSINIDLWKKKKKQEHYTFNELATLSGIPKRTLEDIFAGRTPSPRIDTVQAIEKALDIKNGFTDEERLQGANDAYKKIVYPDEDILLDEYRDLDEKEKQMIKGMMKQFKILKK